MGFRNRTSGYELANAQLVTPVNSVYSVTAAQDDTQLIAARSGFRMRVFSLAMTGTSADGGANNTTIFRSIGGATSALTGSITLPAAGLALPYNPNGWFQTASGDGLFMSIESASASLQISAACIPV